ncbi:hypothetical protein GCM10007932_15490 [Vibrio penaeicida]|uniref:Uncharacterized protein n=1 Tax=Vibrio penaeicida TaxID=104609 RepID=A0AAV5NNJ6_9VIBR|nr:hypothetical protein GCM10007932_15490 [Vibrio penaeicida]
MIWVIGVHFIDTADLFNALHIFICKNQQYTLTKPDQTSTKPLQFNKLKHKNTLHK